MKKVKESSRGKISGAWQNTCYSPLHCPGWQTVKYI